jgi:hypothetical protein
MRNLPTWLAIAQGAYFALTGLWPLFSIGTFMKVTGPKTDIWLVKTVGVLVLAIGAVLVVAGIRGAVTPEVRLLAVASAAGLAGIDVYYVARGTIARIYLADAAVEAVLILLWLVAWFTGA